jgi:WD40 repeat protein
LLAVAFAANAPVAAASAKNKSVYRCDLTDYTPRQDPKEWRPVATLSSATAEALAVAPDGSQVYYSTRDFRTGDGRPNDAHPLVRVWSDQPDAFLPSVDRFTLPAMVSLALSGDGKTAATGTGYAERLPEGGFTSYSQSLLVWDVKQGTLKRALGPHKGVVKSLALSGDGQRVLCKADGEPVSFWDLRGPGRKPNQTPIACSSPTDRVECVAISADGTRGVFGGKDDGDVHVVDLTSGRVDQPLRGDKESRIRCVALSPDGRRVLAGTYEGTVRLWDLEAQGRPRTDMVHKDKEIVLSVGFSPDGVFGYSAATDNTIRRWVLPDPPSNSPSQNWK